MLRLSAAVLFPWRPSHEVQRRLPELERRGDDLRRLQVRVDCLQRVRLIVRQGMTLAIAGVTIGLPMSFALTRLMSSLLFGITPRDPFTFAAVTTLLIGVAAIPCYLPARRATRIEPIVALRRE